MALLDENNKFVSQTNLGWTFSFEANGKYPMIANRIFATKAGAEAYIADTTANATAIPGLILRVIEDTTANNGAYLVEEDLGAVSGLKLTRIVTGTLDISGEMIDVIYYEGDATHEAGFYNKADGSGEPWVPSEDAQPIKDELVAEEGKYLCLILNETDKVYIKSTDLIDLTDYYTKEQVDEKVDILDSSISTALDDIKNYVDETAEAINSSIGRIDASVLELFNSVEDLTEDFKDLTGVVEDLTNDFADISARVDELENNTVKSVKSLNDFVTVDPSVGHVSIDVSVKDAEDSVQFPSSGFVTDGYVEEKMAWVEVEGN